MKVRFQIEHFHDENNKNLLSIQSTFYTINDIPQCTYFCAIIMKIYKVDSQKGIKKQ